MSRVLVLFGLAAFAGLGVAACHSSGPPGQEMPPDPMDPMNMYRPAATAPACTSQSPLAKCVPAESR